MKRIVVTFGIISILFSSCGESTEFYKIAGETQGTTYHIMFEGKQPDFKQGVDSVLRDFDMSLSTYEPNSIISKINQGNNVEVDKHFKQMYYKAKEVTEKSGGAFDITVGPLINAYGFGYDEAETEIDSALIDSLLQYVGMEKVRIEMDYLVKDNDLIQLSGNAIAQGQAVDIVCEYFESKGIKNYMVEIGGELKVKGLKYGQKWRVGIDKPIEGNDIAGQELQTILAITDKAMATSGNYRRFYIKDGKKYSHSIDPKTGYPSYQNILSATILADDCMTADAYATACMVSGLDKSIEMIENDPTLDAYFVYSDKETGEIKVYYSKAVEAMIVDK
ncbi:MAG: FAD:protein FMN transferase [Bacteroidales bacterium]|nr:FAD:protein FMN transferase [Bacteroidales bacterium]